MYQNTLLERARTFSKIRKFFADRNVLEVDTPHIAKSTSTDPHVASFKLDDKYLQTSPEFFMKRLLAAGSGDIYQLAHVFRDDSFGSHHNHEFMLLEWYRLGFNMHELMDEIFSLISLFLPGLERRTMTYEEMFTKYTGVNDIDNQQKLQDFWREYNGQAMDSKMTSRDWLDLIIADIIEPQITGALFVHSYPENQASLAKVRDGCAQRFELYVNGIELANGFDELQDAREQERRFIRENRQRQNLGLEPVVIDVEFLQALKKPGLPQCSGVALGVDRLLMLSLGADNIAEVTSF